MENMENSPCRAMTPYQYDNLEVRTLVRDSEPWFVARDVCDALDIGNASDVIRALDDDEKGVDNIDTLGGPQQMAIVSEAGLYSLILRSRKPEARLFKRWVTHEVLPSIRKHGVYAVDRLMDDPDTLIRALERYRDERLARLEAESIGNALAAQVEANRPKVLFSDAVSASPTTILVGDLAKFLYQNGVKTGQKRLFAWMRENGYLIRQHGTSRNMPTQWAMELGLFEIRETAITHSNGHITIQRTVKVTGKGQQYFIHRFLGGNGCVVV